MVALAYDSPSRELTEAEEFFINFADMLTCLLFSVEAALRIVAQGFCVGQGTYLRNTWNVLDLVIVISAWAALLVRFAGTQEIAGLSKAQTEELAQMLTSLRLIRPLHLLRYLKGVRTILAALTYSGKFLVRSGRHRTYVVHASHLPCCCRQRSRC
jgi:hypothetical protein